MILNTWRSEFNLVSTRGGDLEAMRTDSPLRVLLEGGQKIVSWEKRGCLFVCFKIGEILSYLYIDGNDPAEKANSSEIQPHLLMESYGEQQGLCYRVFSLFLRMKITKLSLSALFSNIPCY